MKPRSLSRPIAVIASCCIAFASYGFEIETSLSVSDAEGTDPTIGIEIDYFFTPLNHSSATPWLETSFVERPSQLTIGGRRFESSYLFTPGGPFAPGDADPVKLEQRSQTFYIAYEHRDRSSPHSFGGSIRHGSFKHEQLSSLRYHLNPTTGAYELVGDPQITENSVSSTRIAGTYAYSLNDHWTLGGEAFFENGPGERDVKGLALQTKRLWKVANQQWISLQGSATHNRIDFGGSDFGGFSRENWLFDLSGAYYLNPKTSIEAGIAFPDRSDVKYYTIGFSRFLNETLFLRANLTKTDFDDFEFEGPTQYRFEFGGRF